MNLYIFNNLISIYDKQANLCHINISHVEQEQQYDDLLLCILNGAN